MEHMMWFMAMCLGLGVLGYGSIGVPDKPPNDQERWRYRERWDDLRLFCFTYTTFPTGDLGGSTRPSQQWMIIAAMNEKQAREIVPEEIRGSVVALHQAYIKPGILFR